MSAQKLKITQLEAFKLQVKTWFSELSSLLKKFHRMRTMDDLKVFVSKCCMLHGQILRGNLGASTHSLKYSIS